MGKVNFDDEYDDEEYNDDDVVLIEDSLSEMEIEEKRPDQFCKKTRNEVTSHIARFFTNKSMHCGGPIPKAILNSPKNISLVINFSISNAIDRSYEILEDTIDKKEIDYAKKTGDSTSDIKLVKSTLDLISRSGVPKKYAGGVLMMYLNLVEGIDI